MTVFTESTHAGEFILSEANGKLSRENVTVTVPASTTLAAGAVLFLSGSTYIPITAGITTANKLAILYAPLTNDAVIPAAMVGVVVDCMAEVRGAALDWNSQAHAVVDTAMATLYAAGLKVRDYTPLGS